MAEHLDSPVFRVSTRRGGIGQILVGSERDWRIIGTLTCHCPSLFYVLYQFSFFFRKKKQIRKKKNREKLPEVGRRVTNNTCCRQQSHIGLVCYCELILVMPSW